MSLSNSRSQHQKLVGLRILGRRAIINASLCWGMNGTTWHSLIATFIAAFGRNFQEATSLEFGMGQVDLIVSDSEEHLLFDLLRMFESVELLGYPFHWRLLKVLQGTHTVSSFEDSDAETERDVRILFPSLRKLKPRKQVGVYYLKNFSKNFQCLISFLRHRSSVGANITTLYRHGLEFNVHQIRLLKELGLQVFNKIDDENEV
jgi:hypothetical protein